MTVPTQQHLARAIALAILLPVLAAPTLSRAQESSETSTAAETSAPTSLADLLAERATFLARQREIESDLARDSPVDALEERLQATGSQVRTLLTGINDASLEEMQASELLDLLSALRSDRAEISVIVDAVNGEARRLEATLAELDASAARWEELEGLALERNAPESVVAGARATRAAVDDLRTRIRERRNRALELLQRTTELTGLLSHLADVASKRRQEVQSRILLAERQPIWRLPSSHDQSMFTALEDQLRRDWSALSGYVRRTGARLATILGVIVALVLWLWPKLRSESEPPEDHSGPSAQRALNHPVASTVLLTLTVYVVSLPLAPTPFVDLLWLAVPIPAAVLVAAVFGREARVLVTALAIALALFPLQKYLEIVPLLDRLVLMAELLGLTAVLLWRLRRGSWEETIPHASWRRAARRLSAIAAVVLTLGAVGALVGQIGAARYLRDAIAETLGLTMVITGGAYLLYAIGRGLFVEGPLKEMRIARLHLDRVLAALRATLAVIAGIAWFVAFVGAFGLEERVPQAIGAVTSLGFEAGAVNLTLGNVITFVLVVALAFLLARFITFALDEQLLPALPLERGVPFAISTTIRYAILLGGFALAAMAAGLDLTKLAFLVGAFSVGLGFGLQNVVNNFVSGLILMFERPVKIGDVVELGPLTGTMQRIGIRSSTVKTFQGAEVIVPNGDLISKEVVNWTLSNRFRRLEIPIGVAYGTNTTTVCEILLDIAQGHDEVVADPEPAVLMTGFGDSSLDFELRCWVGDLDVGLRVGSELRLEIERRLAEAGIEIPFPQRDVHLSEAPGAALPSERETADPSPEPATEESSS